MRASLLSSLAYADGFVECRAPAGAFNGQPANRDVTIGAKAWLGSITWCHESQGSEAEAVRFSWITAHARTLAATAPTIHPRKRREREWAQPRHDIGHGMRTGSRPDRGLGRCYLIQLTLRGEDGQARRKAT
ncbi:hypothetical protein DFH27DRAFT_653577 [Peziza echinospora]|nr:hypothetical protein DFH27DRAFT_653577 [Peziza echinospora]